MAEEDTDGVIPESKIREAHAKCMEDPALAKYFNDAPQGAKEYIALMFYCTVFQNEVDDRLYETYQKEVEEGLTREDILYLATHDRNPQSQAHFRDLLAAHPEPPKPISPLYGGFGSVPSILGEPARTPSVAVDTRRLELAIDRLQASVQRIERQLEEREKHEARHRFFRTICLCVWLGVLLLALVVGASVFLAQLLQVK